MVPEPMHHRAVSSHKTASRAVTDALAEEEGALAKQGYRGFILNAANRAQAWTDRQIKADQQLHAGI